MDPSSFKTPVNPSRLPRFDYGASTSGLGGAVKRDSLAAELERDPQLSTAKRRSRQHLQTFTSSLSHAALERQLLTAQTTLSETQTKLREKELAVERLERDRRYFCEREKEEREGREREQLEATEARRQLDAELRSLRTQLSHLRDEHADLRSSHSSLSLSSSQSTGQLKSLVSQLQTQVQLLTSELDEARQLGAAREATIARLQDELDAVDDAEHANRSSADLGDMEIVREELGRQAGYLRSLESTNAKLSAEVNQLKGRHESIEAKLSTMGELREKCVTLEAELNASRAERASWAASPSKSSSESMRALTELRLSNAQLLEESGSLRASLRSKEIELEDVKRELEENRAVVEGLESDVRSLEEEVGRERRRRRVVEGERGWVGGVLASYKAEEALASQSSSSPIAGSTVDAAKLEHVAELEALLGEYKAENERLVEELEALEQSTKGTLTKGASSEELDRLQSQNDSLESELKTHLATIAGLEEQIKEMEKQIETLEQTLFELSGEIAGGRHVPPNVRVLGFGEQPDQKEMDVRRETVEKLRGENEALLRRIQVLEESGVRAGNGNQGMGGGGGGMVPRESWEQVKREKGELEDVVRQKEKRLKRLQEVFASKSAEFREAIASILGLKLAFYPNGQVRVTSMYDLTASFVFQPNSSSGQEGMKMQLIAQTECNLADLPNMMHYWIEAEQCPPGFIASVTLECYERWKSGQEQEAQG
ncbi:MAD-domain-containing protein [Coprinellus micaceus]|uniref:Spindle assembly checkpoint component MAD1 n=1 Tax=Coprinellus micaceus TaxID=71717 RepID=A0A4Y7SR43_COPMI|nr:MAD-domain-containing protein [Coprinellus micaceus]